MKKLSCAKMSKSKVSSKELKQNQDLDVITIAKSDKNP
jgi:hypothetical protein